MHKSRLGICLWVVVSAFCCASAHASTSTATPEDEYKKLIRVSEDIQPLGEHPFGENISLYNGALSFEQTDVSLAGNGPLLQLTRQFGLGGLEESNERADYAFGDWDLVIPHIETLTADGFYASSGTWHATTGWTVDAVDPSARCSGFAQPLTITTQPGDPALTPWDPSQWWKGYRLVMPGSGGQDMLRNPDVATRAAYPAVTKEHWRFSCLASTANGLPGEGFQAQAPDGTKYWFNELVYRYARSMSRSLYGDGLGSVRRDQSDDFVATLVSLLSGSGVAHAAPTVNVLGRRLAWMMVTRIEDRFGNSLVFSYSADGLLTGITASDGRALSITYVSGTPRIQSVTLQPSSGDARTWTYGYSSDGKSLVSVTQPDSSRWLFDLAAFDSASLSVGGSHSSCITLGVPSLSSATGSITHPSGLVGTFTVKPSKHGRSNVPRSCTGTDQGNEDTQGSSATVPDAWYSFTVIQKSVVGAGVPAQTWNYNYSPANESWSDCTGSCPTTVWTDVVNPDGSTERSTFSNRFDFTESQLQRTDYYAGAVGASALLRTESSSYAPPTTSPLPASAGGAIQSYVNYEQIEKYSPLNQRVITQGGDTYTWQAETFNSYAQVTKQKRFNSISGQPVLEESLGYLNDTNLWVLGLPTTVTNVATGEVESQNVYESAHDTLSQRWRFGQQLMSYTFDSAGNLHTFTDGRGNTTTLSSYKRGIPQSIQYPATPDFPSGTSESLAVDDFGQISSLTDQAGKTTSYAYDGVGRLTQITYPSGDSVAWAPKVFTYAYVTAAERGIGANHWRRTVSHGNARSVTYFDAELRPVLSDSYLSDGTAHTTARTDYDWRGQKTFASYPQAGALNLGDLNSGITTQYDALGRVHVVQQDSELSQPPTTTTEYLSGARTQVTDPKGKVTTTTYQVFDQPSYDAVTLVQAPDGINQAITRDVYGNPTSIRQYGSYNGLTKDLTKYLYYDAYHRLCRTAEPESGSTVMAYDAANNVAWTADGLSISGSDCGQGSVLAAAQTTRTYDAMNRVKTLVPSSGTQATSYTYDALGNVQTAVSGISTWSAGPRNGLGLLTSETLQITGQSAWTLGYGYDANGALSSISYPDGSTVSYAPDGLGRPTQVGSYATGVTYFANGEVSAFTFGNGALYAAQQNTRQLLSNFSYAKGSTLNVSEDYAYDNNANITQITDLTGGLRTKSFSYDDLNRLTGATATNLWGTESYTYDPLNNIASRTGNSTTVTYSYDATNRLMGLSDGTTFGYDPRGNVINKNGVVLGFDAKNQLQNVGGSVAYAYDASGRRVSKTPSGGGATYYFYSQAGQLMYQLEPASFKRTSYVYLGKRMIARNETDSRILTPSDVSVTLTLAGGPTLSADAQTLSTTIDISNQGSTTLTSTGPYPVRLGDHIVSPSGSVLVNDLDRVAIPDIAPGQHATVTITTPASSILGTGNRLQFVPVQEGGSWFTSFGTTPVTVGPYVTPTSPAGSTTGSYTVSWAGLAGADSYNLQERVNGGSWTTVQSGTAMSRAISGKGNGTYGYQVQACNGSNCSVWSSAASTTVLLPPPAPASISVPATSSGSVAVSWAASSTATSYTLQQRLGSGGWSTVYTGATTSSTRTVTTTGSYAYQVQACNASGCSGWTGSGAVAVTIPPGSAPALTVPASNTTGSYTVTWTGVSGATSYTLQEQVNGGGWSTIQATNATSRAIGGKGSSTYGYRVQACNVGGCSGWSATGTVSVLLPPATPTGLVSTLYVTTDPNIRPPKRYYLEASWAAVQWASSYELYSCLSSGSCGTRTVTTNSAPVEEVFGVTVSAKVRACNATGCSAWSATVVPTTVNE